MSWLCYNGTYQNPNKEKKKKKKRKIESDKIELGMVMDEMFGIILILYDSMLESYKQTN